MDRLRNRHFFVIDIITLASVSFIAFVLRLERFDLGFGRYLNTWLVFASCLVIAIPLAFRRFGLYSRWWRYVSIDEVVQLILATFLGTLLAAIVTLVVCRLLQLLSLPSSIPAITFLLAMPSLVAGRLAVRITPRYRRRASPQLRAVIYGAGATGAMIMRELNENPQHGVKVIAFLDDDASKHAATIHGVPVVGGRPMLQYLLETSHVDKVILALPNATGQNIRELRAICTEAGVMTQIIPGIDDLLENAQPPQLRNIQIEDLLRRAPVTTDFAAVAKLIQGKRVLVTGGGGTIGGELCRQLLRFHPSQLLILGHGENSVFELASQLKTIKPPDVQISTAIADIRFADRIAYLVEQFQPDMIFHAAAHKHVKLMEDHPVEAVTNNISGTQNILAAALRANVPHFVMISSDKAVNPTGMMGASKRVGELLVLQAATQSGKPYAVVRFGNVLGSRGSVLFTFQQQIARGGPITVTHPDITRFFMTIPEAVQLVLQASTLAQGGEIFVLDMGVPIKIVDLAQDLIALSGLRPDAIQIQYTGLQPGEKMYEELFGTHEQSRPTIHEKILSAVRLGPLPVQLNELVERVQHAAQAHDIDQIYGLLQQLLPEYHPAGRNLSVLPSSSAASALAAPSVEVVNAAPDAPTVTVTRPS